MSSFNTDIVSRDYEVNIGAYFSRGWEIFKQFAPGFIGYVILLGVIGIVLGLLPAPLGNRGAEGGTGLLPFIYQVFIAPVLSAGFYIVAFQIARNRSPEFSDFFRGFNRYLPIFLVSLISGLLIVIGIILLIIPGIYLAVSYLFSLLLVIDKNMSFWNAMETSRRLVSKKWFSFFGLLIVLTLLNIAGAIVFGLGLLVTFPLTGCIIAAAYEDIVGLNSTSELEA
ncbi:hypothetical protein C7271_18050 [filamentous cyanobacterium CCP5]|nr:hypothetical protein C7271_18050 [filamentous cyanobacterium CCP5]